jgi:hypothetical protein
VALTLSADIEATTRTIAVTGTVPDDIEAGYAFRLDDELLTLTTFALHSVQYPGWTQMDPNRNAWIVKRGVAVAHSAGTAVKASVDAYVSASDDDPPPTPFASSGGGGVTPGPYLDPTTLTPEAIGDWLIANLFMEPS